MNDKEEKNALDISVGADKEQSKISTFGRA